MGEGNWGRGREDRGTERWKNWDKFPLDRSNSSEQSIIEIFSVLIKFELKLC